MNAINSDHIGWILAQKLDLYWGPTEQILTKTNFVWISYGSLYLVIQNAEF